MRQRPVNQRFRIRTLQAGGLFLIAPLLLVNPMFAGGAHEAIEIGGFVAILACVLGRMWSILYVGPRKNRELVTAGPYSMTRNPLYFFSTLGAVGVGLSIGSVIVALLFGLFAYLVLHATAIGESQYLRTLFGQAYDVYARETPMFWPDPSRYREAPDPVFSPAALRSTFLDGLIFLCAFPLIELIEYLQAQGHLPVLLTLF